MREAFHAHAYNADQQQTEEELQALVQQLTELEERIREENTQDVLVSLAFNAVALPRRESLRRRIAWCRQRLGLLCIYTAAPVPAAA